MTTNTYMHTIQTTDGYTGFLAIPKQVMRANSFVSKVTGDSIDLTANDKLVFHYMVDAYCYYHDKGEGHYIESHVVIAENTGLSLKVVKASIDKFAAHKLIERVLVNKRVGYAYTGFDVHQQWTVVLTASEEAKRRPNPVTVLGNVKGSGIAPKKPVEVPNEPTPTADLPEPQTSLYEPPMHTGEGVVFDEVDTDEWLKGLGSL